MTFVSNYHEGGAERPLANLSAVNYGNLPSCLSASAAGLPFVSKSKAGICNIGTFSFLQGHGATQAPDDGWHLQQAESRAATANAAHSSTRARNMAWEAGPSRSETAETVWNNSDCMHTCTYWCFFFPFVACTHINGTQLHWFLYNIVYSYHPKLAAKMTFLILWFFCLAPEQVQILATMSFCNLSTVFLVLIWKHFLPNSQTC